MHVITINRQFGSGGREIAKRLAEELGFAYYDREIITAMAKEVQLDESYLENAIEKAANKTYPLTFSRTFSFIGNATGTSGSRLLAEQHKFIRKLAAQDHCVIVGRASEAVLEDCHPFKIFVYADMEARLQRCKERSPQEENLSDKELRRKIKEVDHYRSQMFSLVSCNEWGNKELYDLCINTTHINIAKSIPALARYILTNIGEER